MAVIDSTSGLPKQTPPPLTTTSGPVIVYKQVLVPGPPGEPGPQGEPGDPGTPGVVPQDGTTQTGVDAFAFGHNTSADADYSVVGGDGCSASGSGAVASVVIGENCSTIGRAVACFGHNNIIQSDYCLCSGDNNGISTFSSGSACVGSSNNVTTGCADSACIGNQCNVGATISLAVGFLTRTAGAVSFGHGDRAVTTRYGQYSHSSCYLDGTAGTAQYCRDSFIGTSTNAVQAELKLRDGTGGRLTLEALKAYLVEVQFLAVRQDVRDAPAMEVQRVFIQPASGTTFSIVSTTTIETQLNGQTWTFSAAMDGTNTYLQFLFTGASGQTVACMATAKWLEVQGGA